MSSETPKHHANKRKECLEIKKMRGKFITAFRQKHCPNFPGHIGNIKQQKKQKMHLAENTQQLESFLHRTATLRSHSLYRYAI